MRFRELSLADQRKCIALAMRLLDPLAFSAFLKAIAPIRRWL